MHAAAATFLIGTARLHAREVAAAAADPSVLVVLSEQALEVLGRSREVVQRAIESGHKVYGLNTLLGSGRDTAVAEESILAYQVQVVRYHDSGVGGCWTPPKRAPQSSPG